MYKRQIKKRVMAARAVQQARLEGSGVACNARMQPGQLRRYCALGDEGAKLLKTAFDRLALTARSYDRILKVARTIADLDGSAEIGPKHIAEAIQYRSYQLGKQ